MKSIINKEEEKKASTFKVGCSPFTSKIYAGKVSKNGLWVGTKYDVTYTAPSAVAEHLLQKKQELQFECRGKKYALRVVELKSE